MRKKLFVLMFCLFFGFAFAETIIEDSFQDMGLKGFENIGVEKRHCEIFPLFKDLNQNSPEFYTVVSLHTLFEPVASKDANILVFLNGKEIAGANAKEFYNDWLRVNLPAEELLEENSIRVCLTNSNTTTKTILLADSLYGTYKMAEIKEGDFSKVISNYSPFIGQVFSATVYLHNSGSESVDVNVLYRKPEISFKHLPFVKGETSFFGTVLPDETISFSYSIKSTKTGPFALPAAVVFFENEFGEKQKIVSNYPLIEVLEPEIRVQGIVLNKSTEKNLLVGKSIPLQAIITNNGANEIVNIAVIFPETEGLQVEQETQTITSLKPGESTLIDYSVVPLKAGSFEANCKIAYLDFEIEGYGCDGTGFFVEEKSFPVEWIGGIILLIIAVLIYLYYNFR